MKYQVIALVIFFCKRIVLVLAEDCAISGAFMMGEVEQKELDEVGK